MVTKSKTSKANAAEEKTFVEKLSDQVRKNRKAILVVVAVIALALVAVAAYSIISNATAEASSMGMEAVRTKIAAWTGETDETKKADEKTAILADIDAVAKKWPRSFAAQEALFVKAGIIAKDGDNEGAEAAYLSAANVLPKTYLAPIALEAAAVAAEERGAADKAAEYYKRIVDTYKAGSGLPHAIFSLGRLAEGRSEWPVALENYEKLAASYPDADWTKLAKDRIIFIKATGLVK